GAGEDRHLAHGRGLESENEAMGPGAQPPLGDAVQRGLLHRHGGRAGLVEDDVVAPVGRHLDLWPLEAAHGLNEVGAPHQSSAPMSQRENSVRKLFVLNVQSSVPYPCVFTVTVCSPTETPVDQEP